MIRIGVIAARFRSSFGLSFSRLLFPTSSSERHSSPEDFHFEIEFPPHTEIHFYDPYIEKRS